MKGLIISILLCSILGLSNTKQNLNLFNFKSQFRENNSTASNCTTNTTVVEKPYTHLLYFLQYVLLGPPKNACTPDIFDLIQEAPDDIDLFTMIAIASQNFYLYWIQNEYDEETFEG
jgi:hypothetical protein